MALSYLPTDSDGEPCRFTNYYACEACGVDWTDQWSCACDDECPECGASISPYDSDEETEEGDERAPSLLRNIVTCDGCGRLEHIDLLDTKPNDPSNPAGCDWERFECIACYGPEHGGWFPAGGMRRPDLVSMCDELHGLYLGWRIMNWLREVRAALRLRRIRRMISRDIARLPITIKRRG